MGSPISFVVAEIIMQNVEEQALASYSETLPLWLSYCRLQATKQQFERTLLCIVEQAFRLLEKFKWSNGD